MEEFKQGDEVENILSGERCIITDSNGVTCNVRPKSGNLSYRYTLEEMSQYYILVNDKKPVKKGKHKCYCDLVDMLMHGCKCGGT